MLCATRSMVDISRSTGSEARRARASNSNHPREIINKDVTNTTQEDLDGYSVLMDTQVCDDLHKRLSHCTPGEFLAEWVEVVGPNKAGQIIWG